MGRPRLRNEDREFWTVVYNELSRDVKADRYIKSTSRYRYQNVYPSGNYDIKIYKSDSCKGLDFAKSVADHFDLDFLVGTEKTKEGISIYGIIRIPSAIAHTIYEDDYED